MKLQTQPACINCIFRQLLRVLELTDRERNAFLVFKEVTKRLSKNHLKLSPATLTTKIFLEFKNIIKEQDPYKKIKERLNQEAQEILGKIKKEYENFFDNLEFLVKLAIAGNVIDLGAGKSIKDLYKEIKRGLSEDFDRYDFEEFEKSIKSANVILYLLDNAGEVIFDKPLVDFLKSLNKKVFVCVKKGAILNDVVSYDIERLFDKDMIIEGSHSVGVLWTDVSLRFKEIFKSADCIISKGQGNFETLYPIKSKKIFFLLQVKCKVVADFLNTKRYKPLLICAKNV